MRPPRPRAGADRGDLSFIAATLLMEVARIEDAARAIARCSSGSRARPILPGVGRRAWGSFFGSVGAGQGYAPAGVLIEHPVGLAASGLSLSGAPPDRRM